MNTDEFKDTNSFIIMDLNCQIKPFHPLGRPKNNTTRRRRKRKAPDARDPAHKKAEEDVLSLIDDLNTLNLSLLSDRMGKAVFLSDVDDTERVSVAISHEENALSTPLPSPLIQAPVTQLKKKLLILDLNGLLVDMVSPHPKDCKSDIIISRCSVFRRPFYHEFLNFCFERFEVAVWSSRMKKNIDKLVNYLLEDMKHKLLFCWDLSHCTASQFKTLENKHKPLVFKELRKIWEKHDPKLPWEKGYYNESNTLLVDDSPYKALLNPMHTAIFPLTYDYRDKNDNSLGDGGDLRVYLEGLAATDNVQKFVEQHPFGQGAITEGSASWDFYFKVLSTLHPLPTTQGGYGFAT